MKRLSILISLSFSLFFPSCQTVREVAEIPAADPVEWILINGDVFVEKEKFFELSISTRDVYIVVICSVTGIV